VCVCVRKQLNMSFMSADKTFSTQAPLTQLLWSFQPYLHHVDAQVTLVCDAFKGPGTV